VRLTEQLAKKPQQAVAIATQDAAFAQNIFIVTKYNKEFILARFDLLRC
jgi:hypothetical protein